LEQHIHDKGLTDGIVLRPETKAGRKRKPGSKTKGVGLSLTAIQRVWDKWCMAAGIPVMSPRIGRAYFACVWYFVDHKNIYDLQAILRHDDILATEKYLSKIHSYEDLKTEFYRGKKSPFLSPCTRFDACPLAASDCHCRMFQPKIEVKNVE
jgi:integrase